MVTELESAEVSKTVVSPLVGPVTGGLVPFPTEYGGILPGADVTELNNAEVSETAVTPPVPVGPVTGIVLLPNE